MDIKNLLGGYQNRMLEKIDKEAKKDIEQKLQEDSIKKGYEQIKQSVIDQIRNLHESIPERDGSPFSEEDFEHIADSLSLPLNYKITKRTQEIIDQIQQTKIDRKEKLSATLNEVHLLTSYLEDPKEVTAVLNTYGIIKDGKLNMSLV